MKTWGIKSSSLVALALLTAVGCSKGEDTLSKRGEKANELLQKDPGRFSQKKGADAAGADAAGGDADAQPDAGAPEGQEEDKEPAPGPAPEIAVVPRVEFSAISFSAVKGFDAIPAEQINQSILLSKVSGDDLILFQADGTSLLKKSGDAVPDVLKPIVVTPAGATLYTLPGDQFWFISSTALSRRKAVDASAGAGTVKLEQFSTKDFLGKVDKMKVLYVDAEEVIMHLDTHIAIFTARNGKAFLNEFEIAGLPVNLTGANPMAGKVGGGGYWFHAGGQMFLLQPQEDGKLGWSSADLDLPDGVKVLATFLDSSIKKPVGDSYVLTDAGLLSALPEAPAPAAAEEDED